MERPDPDASANSPSKARKVGVYRAPERSPAQARSRRSMITIAVALVISISIGLYLLFWFVF